MLRLICRFFEWIRSMFWRQEIEITIVGLHDAGKTSFVNAIAKSEIENTIPTIGFNMRRINKGKVSIKIWDLGGDRRFRGMWERYCRGVDAIVYMVDAANIKKLEESRYELHYLLEKPQLARIPIIILGNKIDLPNAINEQDLINYMDLTSIENREVCCYMVSCKNTDNIDLTLQWLTAHSKHSAQF